MRKDGQPLDISLTVSPIRDATGRIVGASKTARDITEQKRVQAERAAALEREQAARLEAEAANRAKDEFLAVLSHELRTPLNAVYGWAQMLRGESMSQEQKARALETIARNANAQLQLIDDLLDVSRVASGKMRLNVRPWSSRPSWRRRSTPCGRPPPPRTSGCRACWTRARGRSPAIRTGSSRSCGTSS